MNINKIMEDKNSEINQEPILTFSEIQEQLGGGNNNEEEEGNEDNIINTINNIEGNENASTENETLANQESLRVPETNQTKETVSIKKIESTTIKDVDLENSKNFIEKKNFSGIKNEPNPFTYFFQDNSNHENRMNEVINIPLIKFRNSPSQPQNNLVHPILNFSQRHIATTLIDIIRFGRNKRIAIYKELNGNRIFFYKFVVAYDNYLNTHWFFPNRASNVNFV